ncbi:hypothetical protein J1G34_13785 [Pseudomonas sp. Wu6]|uniref:hypothetical protein n=1 Tax=Pseudomonas sp. Wu6 TaxID=1210129 RepID=UPI001CA6D4D1|nr:hypothetical protein [Pseudomonas sp. Wu6]MBY8930111.1 hypothetical protein [Pseudomonas sp. Wu6]
MLAKNPQAPCNFIHFTKRYHATHRTKNDAQVTFLLHLPAPTAIYVVPKNNHYIIVDVSFLSLHYRDVSRIGSVGNTRFEQARLTAELFFRMCTAHKAD